MKFSSKGDTKEDNSSILSLNENTAEGSKYKYKVGHLPMEWPKLESFFLSKASKF